MLQTARSRRLAWHWEVLIAIDTNLLVYAHREDSECHEAGQSCLGDLADGGSSWASAWNSLHEVLIVVTLPRIYSPPTPHATAFESIHSSGYVSGR